MLSSVFLGEAAFFVWPHLFMMWLHLESVLAFFGCVIAGAVATFVVAHFVSKRRSWRKLKGIAAAAVGLACVFLSIALLLFTAWNVAEFMDWDTAP